jgi:hypothetical protein
MNLCLIGAVVASLIILITIGTANLIEPLDRGE